jgi:hypothetical protein
MKGNLAAAAAAAALAAAGVLLADCGGSSASSTASPKEEETAGPVVSYCTPGNISAKGHFTPTDRRSESAYRLTLHNKSASTALVRHMNVLFLVPRLRAWSTGNYVSYTDIYSATGASTGKIAGGETVSWVFNVGGSGNWRCALYDWSSTVWGTYHKSHPWPPK